MCMKIKLWIIPSLSLLCFSLTAQSPALDPRQNKPSALLQTNNTPVDWVRNKLADSVGRMGGSKWLEVLKALVQNFALSKNQIETDSASCTVDCVHLQISDAKTISEIQNIITKTSGESCKLLSSKQKLKDGKLTDYWAQEMIGADLLREEIEKAPPLLKDKLFIAVFDAATWRLRHDVLVQSLISHKDPQAVLPVLSPSQMKYFSVASPANYMDVVENFFITKDNAQETKPVVETGRLPSFINNSMDWMNSSTIYKAMSRISPPAILVQGSGNSYPYPLASSLSRSRFSKDFDSILVGSLSPVGEASDFSQEGEEVHILAPSDDWLISVNSDGNLEEFGGTSGAAPLVTGSLAGFEWLSGYHPTAKEAKFLLEQTAIPTIHSAFEDPQKNGVGMLNAYKLGMTAKRLKEKCHNDKDCFKQEIHNPANYEFSADNNLLDQVKQAFPKCSGRIQDDLHKSCADKKSVLKKLRQAVLLDIENVDLWKQLQCIYEHEGFSENALGVKRTIFAITEDKNFLSDIETVLNTSSRLIALADRDKLLTFLNTVLNSTSASELKFEIFEIVGILGGAEGFKILQQLAGDENYMVRRDVAEAAGVMGGAEGVKLLQQLINDENPRVRMGVAKGAGLLGGAEGLKILQQLAGDENSDVKWGVISSVAIRGVGVIGGAEGVKLLQQLANDKDPSVRWKIAQGASLLGGVGGEGVKLLFQQLVKDENPEVRMGVAKGAGLLGGAEGLKILQHLANDKDSRVRWAVAELAGIIGGAEGVKLLQQLANDENAAVRREAVKGAKLLEDAEGLELQDAEWLELLKEAEKVQKPIIEPIKIID